MPVLVQLISGEVEVGLSQGVHQDSISLLAPLGLSWALVFVPVIKNLNTEEGHNCKNIILGLIY